MVFSLLCQASLSVCSDVLPHQCKSSILVGQYLHEMGQLLPSLAYDLPVPRRLVDLCCSLCCILQYFPHLHCQSILESYWGHHLNFCCGEFQSFTVSCVTPGDIFLCSRYLHCIAPGESYSSTGQLEVQPPRFTSCLVLWGWRMGLLVPLIVGITIILDVSVH